MTIFCLRYFFRESCSQCVARICSCTVELLFRPVNLTLEYFMGLRSYQMLSLEKYESLFRLNDSAAGLAYQPLLSSLAPAKSQVTEEDPEIQKFGDYLKVCAMRILRKCENSKQLEDIIGTIFSNSLPLLMIHFVCSNYKLIAYKITQKLHKLIILNNCYFYNIKKKHKYWNKTGFTRDTVRKYWDLSISNRV